MGSKDMVRLSLLIQVWSSLQTRDGITETASPLASSLSSGLIAVPFELLNYPITAVSKEETCITFEFSLNHPGLNPLLDQCRQPNIPLV